MMHPTEDEIAARLREVQKSTNTDGTTDGTAVGAAAFRPTTSHHAARSTTDRAATGAVALLTYDILTTHGDRNRIQSHP